MTIEEGDLVVTPEGEGKINWIEETRGVSKVTYSDRIYDREYHYSIEKLKEDIRKVKDHGESEDEECNYDCENCKDGEWIRQDHCPNCSDDSEEYDYKLPNLCGDKVAVKGGYVYRVNDSYSEPRPEDETWREKLRDHLCGGITESEMEYLGFEGMVKEDMVLILSEKIDDLEQELSDCWENQQEYKCGVAELQEELDEVRGDRGNWRQEAKKWRDKWESSQERIEEAKDYIERCKSHFNLIGGNAELDKVAESAFARFEDLIAILPDYDEGDEKNA